MKEETKKTKKFNKKYLAFGILGLFALALVTAGLLTFYGQIHQTVNVEQAVILNCPEGYCTESALSGFNGDILLSKVYSLKNLADTSRNVELVPSYDPSIEDGEIVTSYYEVQSFELYGQLYGTEGLTNSEYDVNVIPSVEEVTYIVDFPDEATVVDVEISREDGSNYHIKYQESDDKFYYKDPSQSGTQTLIAGFEPFKEGSYDDENDVVTFTVKREIVYEQTFAVHLMGDFTDVDSYMTESSKFLGGATYSDTSTDHHEVIDFDTLSTFTLLADSLLSFVVVNEFDTTGFDGTIITSVLPA